MLLWPIRVLYANLVWSSLGPRLGIVRNYASPRQMLSRSYPYNHAIGLDDTVLTPQRQPPDRH